MDRGSEVAGPSYSTMSHFADAQKFSAANHPSVLDEETVFKMRGRYNIPDSWTLYAVDDQVDLIYHTPETDKGYICVGISENAFKCGLRLHLLPLLKKLLKQMGIALGQLDPNNYLYINSFHHRCLRLGIEPRPALFWNHYDFRKNNSNTMTTRTDMMNRKLQKAQEEALKKAQEEAEKQVRELGPIQETLQEGDLELGGDVSGRKRHRVKKEPEIRPYQPDWAILSDYILATGAPEPAKNLGPDLCHSFILPVDRLVYASKPPIAACKELIGHLSLAVPCAASVLEKVEDMSRDIASIQDLQTRADKAKPVLEGFNTQVRDQKDRIEKMEKQIMSSGL
ncbi:hypothetical protein DCAR_0519882 [Daucus carota subsp. sativus]|uniref:Uncharacterized protein n=1 Tax=Daucus carota subsp. sativus TaxID=79200 RepID=A0A162A0C9_DAUCS|nr:hypothetical protein DCAR_0519882 [Daucus carota subsp. sativus]